eukprot:499807-Prymnesium_polylepis.1
MRTNGGSRISAIRSTIPTILNARGLLRPYSPAPFRWLVSRLRLYKWSAPAVGEGGKPPAPRGHVDD